MNSRRSASEEALATPTCPRLTHQPKARVLIGGLGMGFTLRTALATLGKDAAVCIAEVVPPVVNWARGPLAQIVGGMLYEPRVDWKRVASGTSVSYCDVLVARRLIKTTNSS